MGSSTAAAFHRSSSSPRHPPPSCAPPRAARRPVQRRRHPSPPSSAPAYTCATSLCASITKLAVKESCRRRGLGGALLQAAMERCRRRRVQRVSLHVDPARTAAVALYRKAGFQIDVTVEGYYSPQRNAYRMYMDL